MNWLKNLILNKYLQSSLRHLAGLLAGWLLALELDPEVVKQFVDSTQAIILAAVAGLMAQGWSWFEKKDK